MRSRRHMEQVAHDAAANRAMMSPAVAVVSPEQLRTLVRDAVREALAEQPVADEWLGPDDVAELLGYQRSYVAELVRRRGLPVERVGRKLRFRREAVLEWLKRQNGGGR